MSEPGLREQMQSLLRQHAIIPGTFRTHCVCGLQIKKPYLDSHTAHVADVILAQCFQQECGVTDWSTATGHVCTCGQEDIVDEFHTCGRGEHGGETLPVARWVSGWERADE